MQKPRETGSHGGVRCHGGVRVTLNACSAGRASGEERAISRGWTYTLEGGASGEREWRWCARARVRKRERVRGGVALCRAREHGEKGQSVCQNLHLRGRIGVYHGESSKR